MMKGILYSKGNAWYLKYKLESDNISATMSYLINPDDITLEIETKYNLAGNKPLSVEFDVINGHHGMEVKILHIEGDYSWTDIFKRYHDSYRSHFMSFESWLETNYFVPRRRNEMESKV